MRSGADAVTTASRGNAAAVATTRPRLKSSSRGPLRPDQRSETHVHPQRMAKGTRTDAVAGENDLWRLDAQVPGEDVDRRDEEAGDESCEQAHAGDNALLPPSRDAVTALLPVCTGALRARPEEP